MKNQTFGIEIEMNHITRQRAAQVVAETLGEGATFRHTGGAYDAWEVTAPDGRRWKLVSDASIAGPRDQGTEFVSPICRWEDIETVQACVRALRAAGAHADPSRYHLLNLHSVFQKGTIEFRAFNSTLHAGEIKAYIQLCLAISHQALTVASASPARPVTDNPAYTFRCWLLRLGMNGEEFKTARTHLLKHMPGNAAWRNGAETTRRAS